MKPFAYERPATIDEAVAALATAGARALAGGTDLIPQMREGRRHVERIVDLKSIPELRAIEVLANGSLSIGAAASAASVLRHPVVARHYAAIAESAGMVGSLQVQSRASLGGNVCNAAPSGDTIPALISYDTKAIVAGPNGRRELPIAAVATGPGRTSLAPGEILAALILPPPDPRAAACYLRFTPRREMDIAVAGSGCRIVLAADGRIAGARIALASVAPTVIRAPTAEAALAGARPSRALFERAGALAAADSRPISDTRGSADYRRALVDTLTRRALEQCLTRLGVEIA